MQHLAVALLVFAVLYPLTNAYSAAVFSAYPERIYTLALPLDNEIGFIAAMIVPYSWSLILFVASFFMVRTPEQLSQLTSRLLIATLLACLIFYFYPARFSFIRPVTSDWTALGYRFLQLTDKPYNQLPSLHVSYALLLGYSLWPIAGSSHSRNKVFAYRCLLTVICSLIILSTLFTYQHHLLDIIAGLLLALVVLWLVYRLANMLVVKYISVAIAGFLGIAISGFFITKATNAAWFEPISLGFGSYWLASFLLLAALYQKNTLKSTQYWFKKNQQGKLSLMTWLVFSPLLLAYKVMAKMGNHYKLSSAKPSVTSMPKALGDSADAQECSIALFKISDNLSAVATPRLCTAKFSSDKKTFFSQLIVIDVAAEIDSHFCSAQYYFLQQNLPADWSVRSSATDKPKWLTHYLYLPLLDLQPLQQADIPMLLHLFRRIDDLITNKQLPKALKRARRSKDSYKNSDETPITLLNFHCVMGLSRSIAVQVLYLLYCDKLRVENVRGWIAEHYPKAHLSEYYLSESLMKAIVHHKHTP